MGTPAMSPTEPDPIELMVAVIREHSPVSIWTGSPLEGYRRLGNTNRGQIGEDFIRRYPVEANIPIGNGARVTPTDLITKRLVEVRPIEELPAWIRENVMIDAEGSQ